MTTRTMVPHGSARTESSPTIKTTKMSSPKSTPKPSDFFNVLNRDVRNIIYGFMTFGKIRNVHARNWVGFVATCRQAKQESDEEGRRYLWEYVIQIQQHYKKYTGYNLRLPHKVKAMVDLVGLEELTLITDAPLYDNLDFGCEACSGSLVKLLFIAVDKLTIHYTNQNPSKDRDYIAGAVMIRIMYLTQGAQESYTWSHDPYACRSFAISWDRSDLAQEEEYGTKTLVWLEAELRSRGTRPEDIPYHKTDMINALLRYDRDNISSDAVSIIPTSVPKLKSPCTLTGNRFFSVDSDISSPDQANEFVESLPGAYSSFVYVANRTHSLGEICIEGGSPFNHKPDEQWDELDIFLRRMRLNLHEANGERVQVIWNGINDE
ncbi:hypothetical protein PTNB85_07294 [Pyrenophora teres f. teres]|nr:hypothetical protein HRS9122_09285 [Pyrenophora teres f. teres]KAE8830707.1 hypothetical protein PTNB85_07294 [Pyrenophora teres f. teres]KAE8857293.1 hypothetical protein PTNB29_08360 [Pyrenophora teres f. teres]CAA9963064.1 hypothetical protein PTMSG1_06432 [Pyrenophora teres f. maculata]CAE7186672.1 hypothetical protein PTTW11_07005 [Pyrenophora teres f. teres]